MKKTTIAETIAELKSYLELKAELEKQIDLLKAETIDYMVETGQDEITTDAGKCTYRMVIGKRLDTTAFKKDYGKLYSEYVRETSNMRFTCN